MAQNSKELLWQLDLYAGPSLALMLKARGAYQKQTIKKDVIDAMIKVVGDEDGTRSAFDKLRDEQKVLLRLLREQGGGSTIHALKVQAGALGIGNFDNHLHELMSQALVLFNTPGNVRHEIWRVADGRYSNWNLDTQYGIAGTPAALELANDSIELPKITNALEAYKAEPYSIEEQAATQLLHVVWSIVRWAGEREITLTKTAGTLRKADLKALDNQLKEQVNMKGFALALAFETGLLKQKREKISPAPDAPAFFARPAREQVEKLFEAWLKLENWSEFFRIPEIETESQIVPRKQTHHWGYGSNDIPTSEALPAARAYLVGILKRAGRETLGQWQSLASLRDLIKAENSEFLIPRENQHNYYSSQRPDGVYTGFWPVGENRWKSYFQRDQDWDNVEGRFLRQLLSEPLSWLGLVAIGRDKTNQVVAFRLSPLGAHLLGLTTELAVEADETAGEKPLVIQPNFEILAYTEPHHLQTLYQLERFATRERAERVAHYKLDRESVYRGLQDGLSATQMREFLERHSRSGVPQNIAYSLNDWESLWESQTIRTSATIIEADTENEMDAFMASLPEGGATRLAPLWAVVEPRYLEAARTFLATKSARAFDYSIETEQAFSTNENLEIVAPKGNLDLWLRSKLEGFADEIPASTTAARFQITRESVARAAKIGVKAENILKFLQTTGTPPIPANVALTLRGWGGEIKPVALGSMQVLVAAPEVVEQMASIEELKSLLWLGIEGVVLVQSGDVAALKAQLKKRGIAFDGQAETHLKAPRPQTPAATPRRSKPAHRSIEIGAARRNKKTLVPAHPDETEVDLQNGLDETQTEHLLQIALDESRCVVIEYQSKVRLALRKINPLEIFEDGGNMYVGAYDHWRKAGRVFRVDRILRIAVLDEKFNPAQFG